MGTPDGDWAGGSDRDEFVTDVSKGATDPWVTLTRCTLVLPDEELAFLQRIAESNGTALPSDEGLFHLDMSAQARRPVAGSPGFGVMAVERLVVGVPFDGFTPTAVEVLLLDCTLLSASAYAALPGAVELLPQSRVWPPLLLHGDQQMAMEWGPAGLWLAPGLQEALADQDRVCGQPPDRAQVTYIGRRFDGTVLPDDSWTGGASVVAGGKKGFGSEDAVVCTISGYAPELVGGRTFTDLKGTTDRCEMKRPLALRNLVLYNLAPGGVGPPQQPVDGGPKNSKAPRQLKGQDGPWANSSLPLWYFRIARYLRVRGSDSSFLRLQNVTLVVPEPEWRALVAAVLMTRVTTELQAAAAARAGPLAGPAPPQRQPVSYDPSSGTLVLAVARHYGWEGTNVTITFRLPDDAPPGARLLPYGPLDLPYKELADGNVQKGVVGVVMDEGPGVHPVHGGGAASGRLPALEPPKGAAGARDLSKAQPPFDATPTTTIDESHLILHSSGAAQLQAASASADSGVTAGAKPRAAAQPPADDERALLHDMDVYFSGLRDRVEQPHSDGGEEGLDRQPTGSQRRWYRADRKRDLSGAIRALQAGLQDAELEVFGVLGNGAFGVVYGGTWRGLPAAVKTLVVPEATVGKEGRARQRAVLEAAISMSMAHPNVVVTYTYELTPLVQQPSPAVRGVYSKGPVPPGAVEAGDCEGASAGPAEDETLGTAAGNEASQEEGVPDAYRLYIVQELCNGGTLRKALSQGMAGSIRTSGKLRILALRLALDVAEGMRHVHSCNIVHGDLKPEPGSALPQLTAKVADFGLSLPLAEGATHAFPVVTKGQLSPRSDVWSFGMMLVEFYYGCTLEDIAKVYSTMLAVSDQHNTYRWLCTFLLEDVLMTPDHAYGKLVAACLSEDPRTRPTFAEIVRLLKHQIHGNSTQEGDTSGSVPLGSVQPHNSCTESSGDPSGGAGRHG
ncbi:hypothetical protein GPECTOR_15g346 [Gonium pectorale]|uniref:Protein kinase domain-containing protein n=1 Tax=Gonium pectorale TaxID=33097 RepID=A0A150GLH6_GONPE|nr:hypothetical protein GPECTOR_15g346 [Gonium pectorale]|eukprot:KXZ50662.1 hypothetical protein GPECTOR_15g346 [Gonium pectorale]